MDEVTQSLEASWRELRRAELDTVGSLLPHILTDMDSRRGRDELSAWLLCNAGFLVQSRRHRFGIDLSLPPQVLESGTDPLAPTGMDTLEVWLVTHRHADHCNPELTAATCRANPGLRVLAPAEAAEILCAGGVPAGQVTVITAGDSIDLDGLVVSVEAGDHMKEDVVENLVLSVHVDGFALMHTGDNCNRELTFRRNADMLLFGMRCRSVEGEPFTWGFPDIEDMVEQVVRMQPRHLVCCHLNEVNHVHNEAWRFLHAALLKERLWIREPGIRAHLPAPGERVTCDSAAG